MWTPKSVRALRSPDLICILLNMQGKGRSLLFPNLVVLKSMEGSMVV